MKKTTKENIAISQFIENTLGITFINEEFSLGKWGETDNWCQVSHDRLILLECEKSQKHPNTNVLKIYPYLEEFPKVQIIFLHYFFLKIKLPKTAWLFAISLGKSLNMNLESDFNMYN
jgi:hypothetical protein